MTVSDIVGEKARWSDSEHLLATIVDVLAQANWMYAAANSKRTPPEPQPIPRPGTPQITARLGGRRSYSKVEVDRMLSTMRPANGGD